jgi:hypothetical protein
MITFHLFYVRVDDIKVVLNGRQHTLDFIGIVGNLELYQTFGS